MSTKEFTAQEIAELIKEFRIANASTQWKFMQTPEYAKLPLAARCTVERNCLTYYFDKLSEGMTDWKNPICARIPTEDFDVYDRACAYFTGTELQTFNIDTGDFKRSVFDAAAAYENQAHLGSADSFTHAQTILSKTPTRITSAIIYLSGYNSFDFAH